MRGFNRNVAECILGKVKLHSQGRIVCHYTRVDKIDSVFVEKDGYTTYPYGSNTKTSYFPYSKNFVPEQIDGYTCKVIEVTKPNLILVRDLNSMLIRSYNWYVAESSRELTKEEVKQGVKKLPPLNFELVFSNEQDSALVYNKPVDLYNEYSKVVGINLTK